MGRPPFSVLAKDYKLILKELGHLRFLSSVLRNWCLVR